MQNNNIKIFDSLVSRTKIYLVLIFILLVIISFLSHKMIIPSIIIYGIVLWYTYFATNKRKSEVSQHLQDLTLNVNSAAKNSLIHSPFPLIILEADGNIIWRSTKFVSEFANIEIENYIRELLEKIDQNDEYKDNEQIVIEIKKLMLEKQISQREIAEQLNIKPQGLTKLLNKKNFGFEDAQKVLSAMGYDLIIDFQQVTTSQT